MIVVSNLIVYKGHIDLLKALNFIKSKILIPWQLLLIEEMTVRKKFNSKVKKIWYL